MRKGYVRGFHRFMEAYYAKAIVEAVKSSHDKEDFVMVGVYAVGGGTTGEFKFEFDQVTRSLKLTAFSDGLHGLLEFTDVLEAVGKRAAKGPMSLDDLCRLLVEMDVVDLTERVASSR